MASFPTDELSSDEELACRAQRGCASSFDHLLRRFQVPLLHFLRHRSGVGDAEDLLQEAFLRVYENLHRYSPRWTFASWLFTIARRISINHHRDAHSKNRHEPLGVVASTESEPWQAMAVEEDRVRLWKLAADVLPEEQTTTLWLYYVEEMAIREIAQVLGRTQNSVKILLFRARRRLMPLLNELDRNVKCSNIPNFIERAKQEDLVEQGSAAKSKEKNGWKSPASESRPHSTAMEAPNV